MARRDKFADPELESPPLRRLRGGDSRCGRFMERTSRMHRERELPIDPGALQAHGQPDATRLAGMWDVQSLRVAFAAPLCGSHTRTPLGLLRPCAPRWAAKNGFVILGRGTQKP